MPETARTGPETSENPIMPKFENEMYKIKNFVKNVNKLIQIFQNYFRKSQFLPKTR